MNKEIIKYPNSILRKKCGEIQEITEDVKKLGQEMIQTLTESQGLGLAASQIGELKRIIVVQTEKGPEVFINPKIIKKSKETEIGEEGCLSFPELFLKIKRAREVEVEALNYRVSVNGSEGGEEDEVLFDLRGEKIKIKTDGLLARVFQHEIDHLDGILFIDRISFSQKLWRLLKS
ncbi:MAG: peptide deformylase [Candidatus Nealsonbacteria bacterium CG23_combo_of_CG06-09_8_20_14_all_37_18]|uniref:Peptide deformylase n=1 Tax=Candidatus Nealsonbacteria bacterium CG23_combo_of_CG06-09_8_20_14_all_37_18 TaxID=1974720 RepID=A0A2G9YYB0_9BACT|nr:MAG: peptide deformylase [Candidatus Nealsonbacteria bacterium CG23_combo_of_CG06-09_8_20_14_all_37_18]